MKSDDGEEPIRSFGQIMCEMQMGYLDSINTRLPYMKYENGSLIGLVKSYVGTDF